MSMMKCPYCGREYSQRACKPLVPDHGFIVKAASQMSVEALESGASEEYQACPGSGQFPRNAETDMRPLWKDDGIGPPYPKHLGPSREQQGQGQSHE